MGKSNIDQFSFGVRNTYSAHNQFPAITQAEKIVDRTGKPVGESNSSAQITVAAKIITCSPFCSEQLISDYSHSRGGGFELFF